MRMVLTNAEMQALINAGQDVVYKGRVIKNIADLPNDAQILIDYPEYAYNRIEGNSKAILGYQIFGTPSDGNTLVWSNTNKRWEFGAGGGGGSLTVREVDGTPSVTATTLEFDQADGFVVSTPSSGVARLKLSSIPWAVVSKSGSSIADLADKAASNLVMSTNRVLGRTTGSTGAVEEITIGGGLSLSAGVLSTVGTINTGTSGRLPVYIGSNAVDDSDIEYSLSADWKLKIKSEATKSGLLINETTSTPPTTVLSSSVLHHLHVIDGSTYWAIGYSSDATTAEWANYLADDGSLVFAGQNGLVSSNYAYYNDGVVYNKNGSTTLGGIGTVSANKYGLLLTSGTPSSGQSYSLVWSTDGVTQALPASAMADGNILSGQLHFYQDEGTNELKAKWKESGGSVNTITFSSGGSPGGSSGQFQFNSGESFGGTVGVTYANSGAPTMSVTGQSASQLTGYFLGANTSSAALVAIQLGTGGSSGNFIEFRNSSGTAISVVDSVGAVGLGITSGFGGKLHVVAGGSGNAGRFDGAALSTNTVLVARQGGSSLGNLFEAQTSGGNAFFTLANGGNIVSNPTIRTGNSAPIFQLLTPADTTLTASTESILNQFGGNSSATTVIRQFSTGALTTQRENLFVAPTYSFVAASTLTTAATVSITGAPIAGTNATITNRRALLIESGDLQIASGILWFAGTGSSNGILREYSIGGLDGGLAVGMGNSTVTAGPMVASGFYTNQFNNNNSTITIAINRSNGITLASDLQLGWQASTTGGLTPTRDTIIRRNAAAHLTFGGTDSATPVAQFLSVQGGSGTNIAGTNWTFGGSRGTGTGAGGSIIFQTAPSGSSGTTQNALVTAITIPSVGGMVMAEIASPSTPSANNIHLYAKDSGGTSKLAYKNDAGTEFELGASVPTINTSGLGYSLPGQGGTVFLGDTATAVVGSNNQVRVVLFYIDRTLTVDRIGLNGVLDASSQNAAFAIYSADGNTKIADSGAISTTSWSGSANYAISSSATFGPGYYYFAWTSDSTTPTIRSASAATNYYAPLNNGTGTVLGSAANTSSAGVMPSTLGAITDDASLPVPIVRWFKN